MGARFIGLDLAWSPRNDTGLAVLEPGRRGMLRVVALEVHRPLAAIVERIGELMGEPTILMVDAPLVVNNIKGKRECERIVDSHFACYAAGTHSGNRTLLGKCNHGIPRGEELGEALTLLGFPWPPAALPPVAVAQGRWWYECYPHPAHVRLFALERTFAYKYRPSRSRESLRAEYRRCLQAMRTQLHPPIEWTAEVESTLAPEGRIGRAYKRGEDQMDALFCAWLAAHAQAGGMELLGEPAHGAIAVPRAPSNHAQGAKRSRTQSLPRRV